MCGKFLIPHLATPPPKIRGARPNKIVTKCPMKLSPIFLGGVWGMLLLSLSLLLLLLLLLRLLFLFHIVITSVIFIHSIFIYLYLLLSYILELFCCIHY